MGCKPHDPKEVVENAGLYVLAAREIFSKLNGLKNSMSGNSSGGGMGGCSNSSKNNKSINGSNSLNNSVNNNGNNQLCLFVSCFEIYGGKLFDLLNDHNAIKCLEDAKQHVQLVGTYGKNNLKLFFNIPQE